MKKILTILVTITLIGTSTTSLVACNTPQEYTKEELDKLKEEKKINTIDETIKKNLEWIAPQEKPFNEADNKLYYVVWRGNKSFKWKITKFQNSEKITRFHPKNLDKQNEINLNLNNYSQIPVDIDLAINANSILRWKNDDVNYFKSVYRWNGEKKSVPNLDIDKDGNIKVNGE